MIRIAEFLIGLYIRLFIFMTLTAWSIGLGVYFYSLT